MIERGDLDQLRCEITTIPRKHYNHAARALELAQKLMDERDAALKELEDCKGAHRDIWRDFWHDEGAK